MALVVKLFNSSQKRWAILIMFICIGLAFVQMQMPAHFAGAKIPQTNVSVAPKKVYSADAMPAGIRPGIPLRFKIPAIGLDSAIDPVGLTSDGDLAVPKDITSAGWYQGGVRPGEPGSAVIDGHYGWIRRKAAIFNNLSKLQKGDEIDITDDVGVANAFVVRGSRQYLPGEKATAVFQSDDGKAYLNLITCQGMWESSQRTYSTRLVVFAVMKPKLAHEPSP